MENNITYVFGPFRLQTDCHLLRNEEMIVCLQPRVYDLLLYFFQHPGRLLSREELLATVWQGTIVEDTALRFAVNTLRKALHDERKNPRYILTAYKRGYRFLSEVTVEYSFQERAATVQAAGLHYWA